MMVWEAIMSNFVPSDMITFEVGARKNEVINPLGNEYLKHNYLAYF